MQRSRAMVCSALSGASLPCCLPQRFRDHYRKRTKGQKLFLQQNTIFWAGQYYCTCEFTLAVVTYRRYTQDQASKTFIMDRGGLTKSHH